MNNVLLPRLVLIGFSHPKAGYFAQPVLGVLPSPSHKDVKNAGAQSTKASVQRKGCLEAAYFLRSIVIIGDCQKKSTEVLFHLIPGSYPHCQPSHFSFL
jgi:hypothetical protein